MSVHTFSSTTQQIIIRKVSGARISVSHKITFLQHGLAWQVRKVRKSRAMLIAHQWSPEEMNINKRYLPCGCCLRWDEEDADIALCIQHSMEYDYWKRGSSEINNVWDGSDSSSHDDNEFVKMIIARQRKYLKLFDREVLLKMQ